MSEVKTLAELIEVMEYIIRKHKDGAPHDVLVADLNEFLNDDLQPFLSEEED